MKLYSMLDKKAGAYGSVMMGVNDPVMIRSIQENMNPNHPIARFAEDYDLYEVGEFDEQSGRLSKSELRFVVNMAVVLNGGKSDA